LYERDLEILPSSSPRVTRGTLKFFQIPLKPQNFSKFQFHTAPYERRGKTPRFLHPTPHPIRGREREREKEREREPGIFQRPTPRLMRETPDSWHYRPLVWVIPVKILKKVTRRRTPKVSRKNYTEVWDLRKFWGLSDEGGGLC
jgi:hypothetical protein